MNLVKFIRKNNRKIMTFVVIFCMVAFIIGSFGLQMLASLLGGGNRLIADYDDGGKIKQDTFMAASNELNVLKMLMADRFLLATGGQTLTGPLLVKLIFPDSQFAGDIAGQLKQSIQQGQLQITTDELDDYFNQPVERAEVLWILLRAEAYKAGCITSTETARQRLRMMVPQLTQNQGDAKQLVDGIMSQSNITEAQIIRVFADLLSVMDYSTNIMSSQTVTTNQIKATLGRNKERIDADFVKIAAEGFVDDQAAISDADILKQFEAFKDTAAGTVTAENPYGFGYKLPKRVQVEYIVIDLDDVKAQTAKITADEMESYYSRNLNRFQSEEPTDPANPDSEKTMVTKSFSEVENSIRQTLENEKTQTLANLFFSDVRDQADEGLGDVNFEDATVSELQTAAGDFEVVAGEISKKHSVPSTVGKTGLVSPAAFEQGTILGSLAMQYQRSYVRLGDLAFTITEEADKRRRIGMPSYRVWQTVGPLSGWFYDEEAKTSRRLMALVRVIDIEAEAVADSVDVAFDTTGIVLSDSAKSDDSLFAVKTQVQNDLRQLAAMEMAKGRAEELTQLVADKGWDDAIAAYNKKYADDDESGEAAVKLDSVKQQLRVSQTDIEQAKRYMQSNPARASYMQTRLNSNILANALYAMLGEDQESTGIIHKTVVFEPDASCYVVKEVIRQPATTTDYEDGKAQAALQLGSAAMSDLPLIHFSTENILKRMDYQPKIDETEETTDETDAPATETKDEAA